MEYIAINPKITSDLGSIVNLEDLDNERLKVLLDVEKANSLAVIAEQLIQLNLILHNFDIQLKRGRKEE